MDNIKCVVPCLLGLEGLVADELRRMNIKNVQADNGRVFFTDNYNAVARANICSRYGERVLIEIGNFKATTFSELFDKVEALPWEQWIDKEDEFPVKGSSLNSKLSSVPSCQSIIKKAIVKRLSKKYKIEWFRETGALHQIQFLLMKDNISIMIDTSGIGLHKRGYRANSIEAPIKETLAAAMVNLSHIRSDSTLIDTFCGSGTILIEGAMYALNIAPNINRNFSAEEWNTIPANIWVDERERAKSLINYDCKFQAFGYDIDDYALQLTIENAKKAGVEDRIKVSNRNICDFSEDFEKAAVVCNPPYGERLLDISQAQEIYKTMGKLFESKKGWSYSIISPDDDFEKYFGRKADKRRKLYNGMIKCQVYMYFKSI